MDENFYYLINILNTSDILSEEQAFNYLQKINSINFLYNNMNSYDILDYEKIIFIEITYKNNQNIQELVQQIKQNISSGYIYKEKLKERIYDVYDTSNLYTEYHSERYFSGIPKDE